MRYNRWGPVEFKKIHSKLFSTSKTIQTQLTKMPYTDKRVRNYTFTDFTQTSINYDPDTMKLLMYATELCPDTNRQHLQGYVTFMNKTSLKMAKKHLNNPSIHLEQAIADYQHNLSYIQGPYDKDGKTKPVNDTFIQYGDPPRTNQGKRNDLQDLCQQLKDSTITIQDIIDTQPGKYHLYRKTFEKITQTVQDKKYRTDMTKGIWYYGDTGTGKSHRAFINYHPDTHYIYPNDKGWWDGYDGQDTIIINDFRGEITYNQLLQIIDKWPYQLRRRNQQPRQLTASTVIITSSLPPSRIYHNRQDEDSLKQLYRRCKIYKTIDHDTLQEDTYDPDDEIPFDPIKEPQHLYAHSI